MSEAHGIESTIVGETHNDEVHAILQRITIEPGGTTGWHFHPDDVWGRIVHGELTHFGPDGAIDGVYGPGDLLTEPSGSERLHMARNLGADTAVLYAMRFVSSTGPLAVALPDAEPGASQ